MAYDFLGLVNDVNQKMNEVPLTSANFATATGMYSDAKNAVNWAIDKINRYNFVWPFNVVLQETTLVVNQSRYAYEANTKSVAYDTFRIKGDDSLNVTTTPLFPIDYEEYLQNSSDMENRPTKYARVPTVVFRTRGLQFGVAPPPDKAYTLQYEYYSVPVRLEDYDDVPTVPEQFRYVIYEGSLQKAFDFRGDIEQREVHKRDFEKAIEEMRIVYTNRTEYARSTQRF